MSTIDHPPPIELSLNITTNPVDSEMCKASIAQKLELNKQLGIVLQGSVKPSECASAQCQPSSG